MDTTGLILLLSALAIAIALSIIRRKQYGFSLTKSIIFTLLTCAFGLIGTKFLFMLEHLKFGINFGGVSFYGAVFFVPIALFITTLITKDDYGKCMDFFGPYILSTVGIMRIGCYITGCCAAHRIIFMNTQIVPPIQLIEFVLDILLFVGLICYHQKIDTNKFGSIYPKIMIGYSFIRLIMENYRDTDKDVIGMSRGQWYSIAAFLIGVLILTVIKIREEKKKENNQLSQQ